MAYYPSQQEEHQQVLDWLDQVRQGRSDTNTDLALGNILRAFQSGWLAPGPYVLNLLETRPEEFGQKRKGSFKSVRRDQQETRSSK